jgi:hypothetical protein
MEHVEGVERDAKQADQGVISTRYEDQWDEVHHRQSAHAISQITHVLAPISRSHCKDHI